ncbi:class I SAM-dependent methyltransferase [Roseomonas fluvialis]|nr:class I SAM-dependent methyltransferase [Roseomonas fluvialis]
MSHRFAGLSEGRLLEVAAGTGILTRALDATLPPAVRINATDLNPAMLDHAATRLESPRVTWTPANAQDLPFPDGTYDAVACQFGVMFFPEMQGAFAEARRVLKPGGLYVFNVWDRLEENDFAMVVTQAAGAWFPNDPPLFLARTPHGHHDVAVLADRLRRVGFSTIAAEKVARYSIARDARAPAMGYCQGTPLRAEIEARGAGLLAEVTDAAARAIAARFGEGRVTGRIRAHVISASR